MRKLGSLVDQMRTAMLFLHLLDGENSPAKISELAEFLLDGLQPLMPLAVSDLLLGAGAALTSIPVIQRLQLSDLGAETGNLFAKHC